MVHIKKKYIKKVIKDNRLQFPEQAVIFTVKATVFPEVIYVMN